MTNTTNTTNRFATLDLDDNASALTIAITTPKVEPLRPPLEIDGVADLYAPPTSATPEGPSVQALRAKGFDFEVALVEPALPGFGASPNISEHRFVVRKDNGAVFGNSVSPTYGFVQPVELAETFDAALPAGVHGVTVGSTLLGDRLWFTCDLSETAEVTPDVQAMANALHQHGTSHLINGNTPVTFHMLGQHAYGGQGPLDLYLQMKALVCANGMRVPLKQGNKRISIRHTTNFAERVELLQQAFEAAGGMVEAVKSLFETMAGTTISGAAFAEYAKAMFPGSGTQTENKRTQLEEAYYTAPGAAPGTAWGALQAGTYYGTHLTPVRVGGRSLSRFTLDDPDNVTPMQLEGYQGQARLESMVYGSAGAFTERAFQYVTTTMIGN